MNFETNTLYIVLGVIAALLVLFLVIRALSKPKVEHKREGQQPYVASTDRPYLRERAPEPTLPNDPAPSQAAPQPAVAPVMQSEPALQQPNVDSPQGNSVNDEIASAATDVVGEMLEINAHGELPGAQGLDDFQRIKGVGPKLAARLNELGITRYDQLAQLSENEVTIIEEKLGPFKGRLTRDRVVEQAGYLARGDRDGFEARFGKLGGS